MVGKGEYVRVCAGVHVCMHVCVCVLETREAGTADQNKTKQTNKVTGYGLTGFRVSFPSPTSFNFLREN